MQKQTDTAGIRTRSILAISSRLATHRQEGRRLHRGTVECRGARQRVRLQALRCSGCLIHSPVIALHAGERSGPLGPVSVEYCSAPVRDFATPCSYPVWIGGCGGQILLSRRMAGCMGAGVGRPPIPARKALHARAWSEDAWDDWAAPSSRNQSGSRGSPSRPLAKSSERA